MPLNDFPSWTYQVEVDGFVPASCLHQKFVRQDAVIGAIPVAVESDAASLPVLVECLLKSFRKPQQDRRVGWLGTFKKVTGSVIFVLPLRDNYKAQLTGKHDT